MTLTYMLLNAVAVASLALSAALIWLIAHPAALFLVVEGLMS